MSDSEADGGAPTVVEGRMLFPPITARARLASIEEQMGEALDLLDARLVAAGTDRRSLLTVHIWLRDMALFDRMTSVWNAWIGDNPPPSRSCVSGGSLDPDAASCLVELVASAALLGPDARPAPIERYGFVNGPGRPTMCLALAYEDWFTVCTLASDGSADVTGQTTQILSTFDTYLAEAGVDKSDVLTVEIWLTKIDHEAIVRAVIKEWLAPPGTTPEWPPNSCVRADMAREDKLVEIRITARRPAPAL